MSSLAKLHITGFISYFFNVRLDVIHWVQYFCLLGSKMPIGFFNALQRWKLMKQLQKPSWEIRFTSTYLALFHLPLTFSVSSLTRICGNLHPFACRIMIASLRNEWASILVLGLCSHHFWQSASCFDCLNISCTDNTFKCPFCYFSFAVPRTIVSFSWD